jgi:glycosyltransferase involved in cell wall biosynthesis
MNTETPLVSIIVPNYNHADFLKERLDSIFTQTFRNFEVIILDDRSTDASLEVIAGYEDKKEVNQYVVNETNSGSPFTQWCKGLQLVRGKYVWIAESDDYADVHFLEELVSKFEQDESLAVVFCKNILTGGNYFDDPFDKTVYAQSEKYNGKEFIKKYINSRCAIQTASSVLFKKANLKDIYFLKNFRYAGDKLFWIKLLESGDVYYLNKPLNYYRTHDANVSKSDDFDKVLARCRENMLIIDYLEKNDLTSNHNIAKGRVKFMNLYWNKFRTKNSIFKSSVNLIRNTSLFKFIIFLINNWVIKKFKKI